MPLLRLMKRKTSLRESLDEFVKAEFSRDGRVELRLYVYEVQESQVVRVHAEHSAGSIPERRPPVLTLSFNLADINPASVEPQPGSNLFHFARETHQEIVFADEQEIRAAADQVHRGHVSRRDVSEAQAHEYVMERRRESDAEWPAVLEARVPWKKWCAKLCRRSEDPATA